MHAWAYKSRGFTIVELLIVIVVIAILAAITIVAYASINDRAKGSAVRSAASQAGRKLQVYAATNNDLYPADKANFLSSTGLAETGGTTYAYLVSTDQKDFCVSATSQGTSAAYTTKSSGAVQGTCVRNYVANPDMESGISGWTGSNLTLAQDTSTARFGSASLQFKHTGAAADGYLQAVAMPATAGSDYAASAYIRKTGATSPVQLWLIFYSGSTVLSTVSGPQVQLAPSSTWTTLRVNATSPASTNQVRVWIGIARPSVSDVFFTDALMLVDGGSPYSYNDTPAVWIWSGAVNNSSSFGPAAAM